MARERKCILCQIVYSSKKEMDEHMRSMLHHRELENLRGRDCSHECRVCRVSVVGLSTYANHISSKLHKDNVVAKDNEAEKEDEEEEYFDKELIQLINQRKEQSQQDEGRNLSKEQELDRPQRRDDRLSYQDINPQQWQQGISERNWQWQNECFKNPRPNFQHNAINHGSNPHFNNPRGRAGWHMNSQPHRHFAHGNMEGSWHSNAGGATSWHQRGNGRSFWHSEANGNFPNLNSRNCVGKWQPGGYGDNQWNFGGNVNTFPQGRNWPQRHCDSGQVQDSAWCNTNSTPNTFCKERFIWKKIDKNTSNATVYSNTNPSKTPDFTSDSNIEDTFIDFTKSNTDLSFKANPANCIEKNNSLSRDKQHRWSPYPSQKVSDQAIPPVADKNSAPCSQETKSKDLKPDQKEGSAKPKVTKDKNMPEVCAQQPVGKKAELKNNRMPSLKSPLGNIPDAKTLTMTIKKDKKNPLKGVKIMYPPFGEKQNRLSALNLETVRSSSSISKLRSAAKCTKTSPEAQESSNKEPVETLSEVLRKAKEMLRDSQAIQSPYIPSMSGVSGNPKTGRTEATNDSVQNSGSIDPKVEDLSDDDLFNNAAKMDHSEESSGKADRSATLKLDSGVQSSGQTGSFSDTNLFTFESADRCLMNESLDHGDIMNSHQSQDYNDCDHFENTSDPEVQKNATSPSNQVLPELSKLGLPVSLQRDLTRHISTKSKAGTHPVEPNLNNARRIRNVTSHRKSDCDKDSGLKPTLRQILNVSRRNINWDQVMQQVIKKRQELGKGLPRFGIEMVAQVQSEQEGLDFDEESDLGFEGYQWEGITVNPPGSMRKRSLSESSVAVEKASLHNLFNNNTSDPDGESSSARQRTPAASGPKVTPTFTLSTKPKEEDTDSSAMFPTTTSTRDSNARSCEVSRIERGSDGTCALSDSLRMFQSVCENVVTTATPHADGGTDSCGSGTEQNDVQWVGKKRRATRDGSCPETSNLERNSKRRKIRGRKERNQVDQLLSISLKEEELSNSLQGADDNLNHARTALQAAYLEVQRLMVLKQQITMEMSSLRMQRIQILQGLQGTFESTNDAEGGGASLPPAPQAPAISTRNTFLFLSEAPHYLPAQTPASSLLPAPVPIYTPAAALCAPATSTLPDSSVPIKQEPVTPAKTPESIFTPLLPSPPLPTAAPPETNGENHQVTSVYPIITATISLSELASKFPAHIDRQSVSTATSPPRLSQPPCLALKHSSERVTASITTTLQSQSLSVSISPKENNCSTAPSEHVDSTLVTAEAKVSKKKKRLRKKKTLRAAHVPENSDTEQEVSKPIRKIKGRRLSKEGTVSTSTSVEQDGDTGSHDAEMNKDNDSDSSIEVMEVPNPRYEVVEIDSMSDGEKPDSPSKDNPLELACLNQSRTDTNDEVTSTSELGTNYTEDNLGSLEHRASTPDAKALSDVSSDPREDDSPTEGSFEKHEASVNAMQVYCGVLYTCSADKSVRAYNLVTRKCTGVFEGHTSKVNCLLVSHCQGNNVVLFTGSSDHTIRCFNVLTKECFDTIDVGERVLCMHIGRKIVYAGLANGNVVSFSKKNNKYLDTFECHGPRAVSCLATAQEGGRRLLLVGSYDCTITVRDASNGLLLRTLEGHTKTVLCMKVVNDLVFSGSSDQSVHAHNIHTGELVRIYKGHNHAVTVVSILGQVMVTACLDKFVRVYELQSHDRLQVYGGHSDMIMCMSIYKSMIYTGCYDGSVQAVRLNLMQNYRCWWHGCSLIFGVMDHLKQHLLNDHTNPNFQTLKCRWKNCDAFFTARRGSKQDAIEHMEQHAEDSQVNT
ncbi:zinc finger protein 106 [Hyperolius riggenbachi]|uniref:zinc finger protein 106 n=1 Tax=Hyperolius riggenbachi TaxID=752182 RepID=UPI0035A26554